MDNFEKELFAEHLRSRIWKRSLSLTCNEDEAEDLMQDTYLRAMEKKNQFDGKNIRPWVMTICRNLFFDQIKKKREILSNDETLKTEVKYGLQRDFEYCFEKLNMEDRELISSMDGSSYKEISSELNITVGNVRVKIFRAREQLMNCMEI